MEQDTKSEGSDELVHSHCFAIAFSVLSKKVEISACMKAKCSREKNNYLLAQTIVMLYVIRIGSKLLTSPQSAMGWSAVR